MEELKASLPVSCVSSRDGLNIFIFSIIVWCVCVIIT